MQFKMGVEIGGITTAVDIDGERIKEDTNGTTV